MSEPNGPFLPHGGCAVNQAAYLLRRQLESQGRTFLQKGGFTESLYAARTQARDPRPAPTPLCPACGQPMVHRSARAGAHAGQSFWGCSAYPRCRTTRPLAPPAPDQSDSSDVSDQTHY
jgi:restriction system protein